MMPIETDDPGVVKKKVKLELDAEDPENTDQVVNRLPSKQHRSDI